MKKKTLAILISLILAVSFSVALAEENNSDSQNGTGNAREQKKAELEQRKTEWQQKRSEWKTERQQELENLKTKKAEFRALRDKFTEERCVRIQERVNSRIDNFGSSKEKHVSAYNNLLSRIDKFIARFENFNATSSTKLDLAEIKADRDQLAVLIGNFKTSYSEYAAKISVAKSQTCGHSEGEFRIALLDARAYLKTVHANAAAVRTFVRETILPDLLELKKQMAKAKGEDADNNEDESESEDQDNNSGTEADNDADSNETADNDTGDTNTGDNATNTTNTADSTGTSDAANSTNTSNATNTANAAQ